MKGKWLIVCGAALATAAALFLAGWPLDAEGKPTKTAPPAAMVRIPGGEFMMGCSPGDSACKADENPAHKVRIGEFWMDATDVTNAQYDACVADGACAQRAPTGDVLGSDEMTQPVISRTWEQADEYCLWAGKRLPTEAEWEYAARGGATGPRYGDIDAIAWHKKNARQYVSPVGQKKPNAFGLYDMLGNAWQWCADHYDPHYYARSPAENPKGSAEESQKVFGIGVELKMEHDHPTVHKAIDGSSAAKAGLHEWNVIEEIGGVPTAGMSLETVTALLRGQPNTTVDVLVSGGIGQTPRRLTLTRGEITICKDCRVARGGSVSSNPEAIRVSERLAMPAKSYYTNVSFRCARDWGQSPPPAPPSKTVRLPGGEFLMGCSPGDADCADTEKPAHTVRVRGFAIDATMVTNAQYRQCVAAGACKPSHFRNKRKWIGDEQPVIGVDWSDANNYCRAAGKRLPTEAEYEFAARGGVAGARYGELKDIAWSPADFGDVTHSVGQKQPNKYGLYDMLGNVWEWCADWYDENYYAAALAENPAGPASGFARSARGGSGAYVARAIRASSRIGFAPMKRFENVGFRCAQD